LNLLTYSLCLNHEGTCLRAGTHRQAKNTKKTFMSGGLDAGYNNSSPNGEGVTLCTVWRGGFPSSIPKGYLTGVQKKGEQELNGDSTPS